MPGKRRPIAKRAAGAISQRLREFINANYGPWTNFEKRVGIPKPTHAQWTRARNPTIPELPTLYAIALDAGLSVDWLLFGSGSPVREREVLTPEGKVIAALEAELRQTTEATPEELDEVWSRLEIFADRHGRRAPFLMAVEGLRPLYNELLSQVRWGESLLKEGSRMAMQLFTKKGFSREDAKEIVSELAREVAKHVVRREGAVGMRFHVPDTLQNDSALSLDSTSR